MTIDHRQRALLELRNINGKFALQERYLRETPVDHYALSELVAGGFVEQIDICTFAHIGPGIFNVYRVTPEGTKLCEREKITMRNP